MAKNKTEDNITKALKWASTLVGASQSLYDSVKEYPSSIELRKLLRFVRASEEEYTALVKKYPRILQRLFYIQDTMGHFAYEDLTSDLNVATMLEMWNRNKQIYTFDSDFLNELLETENFSMTKNAWDYLPYDTFYIDISQNETLYNMFGYGMFIKVEKDIELERYAVYICRITENLYFGDSFPISNDDYEEVIDKTITKEIPTFADPVKDDKNKSYIFQQNGTWQINDGLYKSIIMQILTYLSSIEPDIKESETTKRTYRKPAPNSTPKNKFSEVQMWNVGEDFGISYRKWKKEREQSTHESDGTSRGAGVKKRPHARKAHWSHYWYGSGENKVRRPKWLSATFVNASSNSSNDSEGTGVTVTKI